MKLLCLNWGAYTQQDIDDTLQRDGVDYRAVGYSFADKNHDDFFIRRFGRYLTEDRYDAVFTVNYFPLVAEVCHRHGVKYLSWSYDNPLNVVDIEKTLGYETNYVFLFDRVQAEYYRRLGFSHLYHLPLAVNAKRLDRIVTAPEERQIYSSDISFVGKLYASPYPDLTAPLENADRGYLDAVIEAQFRLYGCYLIDDLLTDSLMRRINSRYRKIDKTGDPLVLTREQLSYAMASHITRRERLVLLGLLSKRFQVKLYSREEPAFLPELIYMGGAGYYTDMPKIFKTSKINLNITLKILQTGIPLRVMDILGCGGFLLSNYQEEIAEMFVPGEEVILYESVEDAVEKADYYLKHEEERKRIAANGHKKAAEEFNYSRQLGILFKTAGLLV